MKANPASGIYEGVLRDGVFQIAAKTREFPVTATSDKMATTIEIAK